MNTRIYKDNKYEVFIDFYKKPAIISLMSNDNLIIQVDINNEYIQGDKNLFNNFIKWIIDNQTKIEDIIWEWNSGNDDFSLIDNKLYL